MHHSSELGVLPSRYPLRVDSSGDIIVNALMPECGTGPGRYAASISKSPVAIIVGE